MTQTQNESQPDGPQPPPRPFRRSLFAKYFVTLFVAVVVPLLIGSAVETWFSYRAQRAALSELLQAESRGAANRIQTFIDNIRDQLGWLVQVPWAADSSSQAAEEEQHQIDALRLLRQVAAISTVTLVDGTGTERAHVARVGLNRLGRGADMSSHPAMADIRANKVWFSEVRYERGSEPHMTIAVAGNRASAGVAIAEINLKLIGDVIAAIRIGETGHAFVIDDSGRLLAHPDISLVLRGADGSGGFSGLKAALASGAGRAVEACNPGGETVIAASAPTTSVDWTVIAQQPTLEAFAPIRAALWRSAALIATGALFALSLAWWLANRMSGPIRQLEDGVQRIGAGQFDHRISISSGDELEQLANRFNQMAGELASSKEKSERIGRLKRFLAPQVAELVEDSSNQQLLGGQRREVIAIFCDLRGFTAFSANAEPDTIMGLLGDYYAALGAVITRHQATLTGFAGDGLMVLVNAPIECDEPALRGVRLAIDMQEAVQALIVKWRAAGHSIGFGVGLAMGTATVGTIGYEGRTDYTAIGSVINLASRLCGIAVDAQILIDPVLAGAVRNVIAVDGAGEQIIKGYEKPLPVFAIREQGSFGEARSA